MANKRIKKKRARKNGEFNWMKAYGVKPGNPKPKNLRKYYRRNRFASRQLLASGVRDASLNIPLSEKQSIRKQRQNENYW